MGLCRSLNVLLGFALVPWPASWMFVLPVGLGLYTAVITYLARDEVIGLALERSVASARMMSVLFVVFTGFLALLTPAEEVASFLLVAPFLVFLGLRGAKLFGPLMRDASGPTVGRDPRPPRPRARSAPTWPCGRSRPVRRSAGDSAGGRSP